jgi:Fe-S cluster assembly protein SufD
VSASAQSSRLTAAFVDAFPAFAAERGENGAWAGLRERAIGSLAELGLPHRKLEEWRYTSLAAVERQAWTVGAAAELGEAEVAAIRNHLASLAMPEGDAIRAVFVDGKLCAALSSLPENDEEAAFHSLADASRGGQGAALLAEAYGQLADPKLDAFTALNTAYAEDGALIEIAAKASAPRPIHLVFVARTPGQLHCPRALVVLRSHARATIIQDHVAMGGGPQLSSAVTELVLEPGAGLDFVTVQRETSDCTSIANLQTRQERDSRLTTHTLCLGGALVRNELSALLADSGAEADLRGLFLGSGTGHVDNHTLVDHAVPHTASRELYKGVLGDASRGVFRGRVVVRPDAQKTDAQQSNPNLLLTDDAEIDTKPQLEIYADDVKCSHGSTIGQLDPDALFYLRARALSEPNARLLLTRGFANEICEALPSVALVDWAKDLVTASLERLQHEPAEESA